MHRWICAAAVLAACGAPPAAVEPPRNEAPPVTEEDPLEVARAVATALRRDTGFGALVDPEVGAWIWTQPGAYASPTWHIDAGSSASLWAMGEDFGFEQHWLWSGFASDLDSAIAHHDRDPEDRYAAAYDHCSEGPISGYLVSRGVTTDARGYAGLDDAPEVAAAVARTPFAYELHYGDTTLFLSRRDGRLYVVHLVYSGCDA